VEPDLVVGTIVSVDDHPGSRAPSYLLRVDLGPRGQHDASIDRGNHERHELLGTQVVVSLREGDAVVVAARSHAAGMVLLRPDRNVEDGTVVA
jgi:tRNA-binding EMAP/Myf-like protein